jgi:hypothetical protein
VEVMAVVVVEWEVVDVEVDMVAAITKKIPGVTTVQICMKKLALNRKSSW